MSTPRAQGRSKEPSPPAELVEVQALLARVLRSPEPVGLTADAAAAARVAHGSAKLSPVEQVDVYREQFWLRHRGSLLEDFPTLRALLGEAGWESLTTAYLAAHPPSHVDLRNLSEAMSGFLERTAPYSADPLLADCARVEWAFIDAFDAAAPVPFDPAPLATVPAEEQLSVRLELQAPLRLVSLAWPAHQVREAVRTAKEGEAPAAAALRPAPRNVYLLIFRTGDALRSIEVEAAAFAVLKALREGATLGEACGAAVATGLTDEAVQEKLGPWFQSWTQWGLLARVVVPTRPG